MALEDRFIYRPKRVGRLTGLGNDVYLSTPDGLKLHARYMLRAYAYFNLLFLHGSTGNLATRRGVLTYLAQLGTNVLSLDYRGYGASEGTPSESGLYSDALAAYGWLRAQAPASSVIVLGEGLGSGPACELAATNPVGAVVLLSAFTNLPELASARYGWLPTRWLVRSRFDNLSKLAAITAPKLIVHSRADERVPFEMGERLYQAAAEPKRSLWLEGARHDQLYSVTGQQLAEALAGFVRTLPAPS